MLGMKIGAAVFMVGFVLAAGCAKAPGDATLATNIKAAMFSDAQLKGAALDLTVEKGVATLSGTVPNDGAHLEAYKVVSQTPGISRVDDRVTVQADAAAPSSDSSSTAASDSAPNSAPAPTSSDRAAAPATKASPAEKNRKAGAARSADAEANASPAAAPESAPTNVAPEVPAAPVSATNAPSTPPTGPLVPLAAPESPAVLADVTPAAPPAPMPQDVEIPNGTTITVRMIDGVDASVNHAGEIFHASLDAPITVNGSVVISRGADVFLRLTQANSAGRMSGKSELHLELVKIDYQGRSYSLVSSTYAASGPNRSKRTALAVGGGAILGTLLGGIAGGGKGAAIGAAAGAGAGGIYQGSSKGKQVKIPAETRLDFQLEQPVTVTVMPHANGARDTDAAASPEPASH
jgi:BON domain-containing protein